MSHEVHPSSASSTPLTTVRLIAAGGRVGGLSTGTIPHSLTSGSLASGRDRWNSARLAAIAILLMAVGALDCPRG